jgi:hypothetical protein
MDGERARSLGPSMIGRLSKLSLLLGVRWCRSLGLSVSRFEFERGGSSMLNRRDYKQEGATSVMKPVQ